MPQPADCSSVRHLFQCSGNHSRNRVIGRVRPGARQSGRAQSWIASWMVISIATAKAHVLEMEVRPELVVFGAEL